VRAAYEYDCRSWTSSIVLPLNENSISETAFCLRLQVEPTQLGPMHRASLYLRRPEWTPGTLSPGVKRPGREADHSPPTNAEAKKTQICASTAHPHVLWRSAQLVDVEKLQVLCPRNDSLSLVPEGQSRSPWSSRQRWSFRNTFN
jgi:hypothetical protein